MFIFIFFQNCLAFQSGVNLHSTMFIFISKQALYPTFINIIYIPLCLYLYQPLHKLFLFFFLIYIPLCLYLYDGTLVYDTWICPIYIPLCLYLYGAADTDCCCIEYIYIPLCLYLYKVLKFTTQNFVVFTFHYVYIYMRRRKKSRESVNHLHSTMFIFI